MTKENSFNQEAFIHYKYFVNVAKRYTRNQMDAEDLVQDTYVRAFRFYNSFRQGSNCKAWLYTIMKNVFMNYCRKYKNIKEYNFDEVQEKHEQVEEAAFTRDEMMKLISNIKVEFRSVIILFHLDDYTLKEISKRLNCPLGTVKSRLHRGRKEFKKVLQCSI